MKFLVLMWSSAVNKSPFQLWSYSLNMEIIRTDMKNFVPVIWTFWLVLDFTQSLFKFLTMQTKQWFLILLYKLAHVLIKFIYSKWFEPRSISSSCSVIVRVSVVLKRTVGDSDWRFDNLSGRHLQSHCDNVPSVDGIYVSGYWPDWSIKLSCYWL